MAFNGPVNISEQDIRTTQAATQPSGAAWSPSLKFGQIGGINDGRVYTYSLNSTVALTAGLTVQAAAIVANHVARTLSVAQAIGSTTVVVPLGNTAATLGQYSGGWLTVVSGTGSGYNYRVKTNTAASGNGTTTVTLVDPILVATDSTSIVDLVPHSNSATIVTPTSTPKNVIGVSDIAVPASNYFWAQTQGVAAVFTDSGGGIAANTGIIPSTTVAGQVIVEAASTITQRLGYTTRATTTSQAQLVNLSITNQ
jgi:hypothetical protein